ncbi:MAG: hypothetical protein HW373_891 [Deltaproteobacteria bacterium]|nr:hypothetical protein [Deltaproteobacteria bacterium]
MNPLRVTFLNELTGTPFPRYPGGISIRWNCCIREPRNIAAHLRAALWRTWGKSWVPLGSMKRRRDMDVTKLP